jgi:hypothetical protein
MEKGVADLLDELAQRLFQDYRLVRCACPEAAPKAQLA